MSRIYTCANCKQTFESDWSDDAARDEAREVLGRDVRDDDSIVCDDCYNKIMGFVDRGGMDGATP